MDIAPLSPESLARYRDRIGLAALPPCTPEGLCALQAAHRRAIAFENFDVRLGRFPAIDSAGVFAKLVGRARGGYCFEHNRLLLDALRGAGFAARMLLARVLLGDPPAPPPRTHCLVLVDFGGGESWIADAGFGGGYAPPLPLADGADARSGDGARHRLRRIGPEGALPGSWLLERAGPAAAGDGRSRGEGWQPQFAFDLAQVAPADCALGNLWAATHPASRFTAHDVASLCLEDGFASLVDARFTRYRHGRATETREVGDAAQYRALLAEAFGIALGEEEVAALPLFARGLF